MSEPSMADAVRAWTEWRSCLRLATRPRSRDDRARPPGEDALVAQLRLWWKAQGLPPLVVLSEPQAELVLAEIARLEWSCRPFDEATA